VTRSDVGAVLGGEFDVRPFAAAEFYKKGLATKVLVPRVTEARSTKNGAIPGHSELNCLQASKAWGPRSCHWNVRAREQEHAG
jgi:hypothetical protein